MCFESLRRGARRGAVACVRLDHTAVCYGIILSTASGLWLKYQGMEKRNHCESDRGGMSCLTSKIQSTRRVAHITENKAHIIKAVCRHPYRCMGDVALLVT